MWMKRIWLMKKAWVVTIQGCCHIIPGIILERKDAKDRVRFKRKRANEVKGDDSNADNKRKRKRSRKGKTLAGTDGAMWQEKNLVVITMVTQLQCNLFYSIEEVLYGFYDFFITGRKLLWL